VVVLLFWWLSSSWCYCGWLSSRWCCVWCCCRLRITTACVCVAMHGGTSGTTLLIQGHRPSPSCCCRRVVVAVVVFLVLLLLWPSSCSLGEGGACSRRRVVAVHPHTVDSRRARHLHATTQPGPHAIVSDYCVCLLDHAWPDKPQDYAHPSSSTVGVGLVWPSSSCCCGGGRRLAVVGGVAVGVAVVFLVLFVGGQAAGPNPSDLRGTSPQPTTATTSQCQAVGDHHRAVQQLTTSNKIQNDPEQPNNKSSTSPPHGRHHTATTRTRNHAAARASNGRAVRLRVPAWSRMVGGARALPTQTPRPSSSSSCSCGGRRSGAVAIVVFAVVVVAVVLVMCVGGQTAGPDSSTLMRTSPRQPPLPPHHHRPGSSS